jgi:hypothetical protein
MLVVTIQANFPLTNPAFGTPYTPQLAPEFNHRGYQGGQTQFQLTALHFPLGLRVGDFWPWHGNDHRSRVRKGLPQLPSPNIGVRFGIMQEAPRDRYSALK